MEILAYIGIIIIFLGGIGFLMSAFRESIWWGLGCFFLYPLSLVFLIVHWKVAKNPFFLQLVGLAIVIIALSFNGKIGIPV